MAIRGSKFRFAWRGTVQDYSHAYLLTNGNDRTGTNLYVILDILEHSVYTLKLIFVFDVLDCKKSILAIYFQLLQYRTYQDQSFDNHIIHKRPRNPQLSHPRAS
jgi:hypothetical protein